MVAGDGSRRRHRVGSLAFLAIYWGSGDAIGSVSAPVYLLVALFSFLPPYRILMVWVYQHTRSLLIGILMHASLTSSMLILGPAVSGRDLLIYDLTLAYVFWMAAVVVLALEGRRTRSRRVPGRNRSRARRVTVGSVSLSRRWRRAPCRRRSRAS